jgi:hypothetical protein
MRHADFRVQIRQSLKDALESGLNMPVFNSRNIDLRYAVAPQYVIVTMQSGQRRAEALHEAYAGVVAISVFINSVDEALPVDDDFDAIAGLIEDVLADWSGILPSGVFEFIQVGYEYPVPDDGNATELSLTYQISYEEEYP